MVDLFWLLLPVAACSGWAVANKNNQTSLFKTKKPKTSFNFNHNYIKGLNLILNDEQDKAIDVFLELFSVDSDTVETHMALGSLFRRRGEVERALRIHQNIIARPNLSAEQRLDGMIELGYDYLCAGVLDRAEAIFKDIIKQYNHNKSALKYLLDIYQQQRDWNSAIEIVSLLQFESSYNYAVNISHYYCELVDQNNDNESTAYNNIKQALKYCHNDVRANQLLADYYINTNQVKKGLKIYHKLAENNFNRLDLILPALVKYYKSHQNVNPVYLYNLITQVSVDCSQVFAITEVIDFLIEYKGFSFTSNLVAGSVNKSPKLKVIANFLELISNNNFIDNNNYSVLHDSMVKLLSTIKNYQCNNCGFKSSELLWICPSCKTWDTIFHKDFIE